jgi:type II secretory pathway pseudopilin PulG
MTVPTLHPIADVSSERHPQRGSTLIELLTVAGIIILLLGSSLSGLFVALRRSDAGGSVHAMGLLHAALATQARREGRSGRVYGYRMTYTTGSGLTTRPVVTGLVPWYLDYPGAGSVTPFPSAAAVMAVAGSGVQAETLSTGEIGVACSAPVVPGASATGGSHLWINGTIETGVTNGTTLDLCFEPGSGALHILKDTAPGTAFPSLAALWADTPDSAEMQFFHTTTGRSVQRIRLFQNGLYEIAAPR